jgi:hypothetical protein
MQDKEKLAIVSNLISEIKNISMQQEDGIYFDHDTVIDLLQRVKDTMLISMRCPRPNDFPSDIPWCESMNVDEEFDPFVYRGDMSIDDFKKVEKKYFESMKNQDE